MQEPMAGPNSLIFGRYPGVVAETSGIWEKIIHLGVERKSPKNSIFTFSSTRKSSFAYIRSGSVTLYFSTATDKQKTQLICAAKSLVNEAPIIAGYGKVDVSAVCNEPTSLVFFDGAMAHQELFPEHPELVMNIAYSQSVKAMEFQNLFTAICTHSKIEQLCWYLRSMSAVNGERNDFCPGLSQVQIGGLLGMTSTSLKRCVSRLKDEKIIDVFTKKRLVITDPERLKKMAFPCD